MIEATKIIASVLGFVLLFLIWWLPYRIEYMRNHGGGQFSPGVQSIKEALTALMTAFTIFAAVSVIFVVLPFQMTLVEPVSVLLGVLTSVVFFSGVLVVVYALLVRPLSGTAPKLNSVYLSLQLMLLGLAFTMFTIATILH